MNRKPGNRKLPISCDRATSENARCSYNCAAEIPPPVPCLLLWMGKKAIRPSNVVNRQILPVLNAGECGKTSEDHCSRRPRIQTQCCTTAVAWLAWVQAWAGNKVA
jgi:hypothetical protein